METTSDDHEPRGPGEHLLAELEWVHAAVREDLATCKRLAADVRAGAAPEDVREEIQELKTNGPLWRLRVNCLAYCRFVHGHHRLEDVLLFPAVREADPALAPAVARLEADHREVAVRLREIEAAADALVEDDGTGSRDRLVRALEDLTGILLAHLDLEEETIAPVLLGWSEWPLGRRAGG